MTDAPAPAAAALDLHAENERLQAQLDTLGQINREQAAVIKKITSHEFVETEFSRLRARVTELESAIQAYLDWADPTLCTDASLRPIRERFRALRRPS